jgi:hypothetical protein
MSFVALSPRVVVSIVSVVARGVVIVARVPNVDEESRAVSSTFSASMTVGFAIGARRSNGSSARSLVSSRTMSSVARVRVRMARRD